MPDVRPQPPANAGVAAYLEWDHRRLDAIFVEVQQSVRKSEWPHAVERFKLFRQGLRRHIDVEEGILFPVFEAKTGMRDVGPTAVMRAEHREILSLMAEIDSALENQRAELMEDAAAALLDVLGGHNRKEEGILYPMCDAAMDEQERERMVARMQET